MSSEPLEQIIPDEELTKLGRACVKGDIPEIRRLIESGESQVEEVDNEERTPLQVAIIQGNLDVVRELVKLGAKLQGHTPRRRGYANDTPLGVAIGCGSLELVQELVKLGANVNELSGQKASPLFLASTRRGSVGIVRFLLQQGANPNEKNDDGGWGSKGIMEAAAEVGLWEVVVILMDHGAVGAESKIFILACHAGEFFVAMKLMHKFKGGFSTDTKERALYYTCLHVTNYDSVYEMATMLIDYGTPVNFKTSELDFGDAKKRVSSTPLHEAVRKRNVDLVWLLMLYGADPNTVDLAWSGKSKTVWDMCDSMDNSEPIRVALVHFWTPEDHHRFPEAIQAAIKSTLLVARRNRWPFDSNIMKYLFSFIAYGWVPAPKMTDRTDFTTGTLSLMGTV